MYALQKKRDANFRNTFVTISITVYVDDSQRYLKTVVLCLGVLMKTFSIYEHYCVHHNIAKSSCQCV